MKLWTGYEPAAEREKLGMSVALKCEDDSLTVQADAKATDINFIMKNYQRTGQLPPISRLPSFGDFDTVSDFRTALDLVREAQDQFMLLPAEVRARFDNDAVKFVEFCDVPENLPQLVGLGILDDSLETEIRTRQQRFDAEQDKNRAKSADSASAGAGRSQPARKGGAPDGGTDH